MNKEVFRKELDDAEATELCAAMFARACERGCRIYLTGELGAGKTTWVRGFLHALGFKGRVKSPTYTLIEEYSLADISVVHMDLYRLADADELEWIGIRDVLDEKTTCLVEWPQRGAGILPPADIEIELDYRGRGRAITAKAVSPRGETLVGTLNN